MMQNAGLSLKFKIQHDRTALGQIISNPVGLRFLATEVNPWQAINIILLRLEKYSTICFSSKNCPVGPIC